MASEEDYERLIREHADFEYVRSRIEELRRLVAIVGPLSEASEDEEFDEIDPALIWTEWEEDDGCSLSQGYDKDASREVAAWFIATNPLPPKTDLPSYFHTVYTVPIFEDEDEEPIGNSSVNLLQLLEEGEMSDADIARRMDFLDW